MRQVPLCDYMKGKKQEAAVKEIGITQSGISQILRSGRNVFVGLDDAGEVISVFEIRGIGSYKGKPPEIAVRTKKVK